MHDLARRRYRDRGYRLLAGAVVLLLGAGLAAGALAIALWVDGVIAA